MDMYDIKQQLAIPPVDVNLCNQVLETEYVHQSAIQLTDDVSSVRDGYASLTCVLRGC